MNPMLMKRLMQAFAHTHEERMLIQEEIREGLGSAASDVLGIGSDEPEDEQALDPQAMRNTVKQRMEEMRIRAGIVDPDRLLAEAPSVLQKKTGRVASAVSSSAAGPNITRVVGRPLGPVVVKKKRDDSEESN